MERTWLSPCMRTSRSLPVRRSRTCSWSPNVTPSMKRRRRSGARRATACGLRRAERSRDRQPAELARVRHRPRRRRNPDRQLHASRRTGIKPTSTEMRSATHAIPTSTTTASPTPTRRSAAPTRARSIPTATARRRQTSPRPWRARPDGSGRATAPPSSPWQPTHGEAEGPAEGHQVSQRPTPSTLRSPARPATAHASRSRTTSCSPHTVKSASQADGQAQAQPQAHRPKPPVRVDPPRHRNQRGRSAHQQQDDPCQALSSQKAPASGRKRVRPLAEHARYG